MTTLSLISIVKLLERANDAGIIVSFSNDELALSVRKGMHINQQILEELRQHKPSLIQYFQQHKVKENSITDAPHKMDRDKQRRLPLSFAQERLWFIDKLQGSIQYHMPWVFNLEGRLDRLAMESAFRMVIVRHEVLRTVILEDDGVGYQDIKPADEWHMTYVTEDAIHQSGHSVSSYITHITSLPYDLSADWMLKVTLIERETNLYTLCILLHHIAFDGWSVSILVRELTALYLSYAKGVKPVLPPLALQYADYAIWQRQYLSGNRLEKKIAYWLKQLKDVQPLAFPTDYPRPKEQIMSGREASLVCNDILKNALVTLSQEEGATLYMTLLSAFNALLYRYVSQNDICIGSPVAGRQQQQLESLIGFFVNTLAIRSHITGEMPFSALLQQVRQTTLEAYEHQDVPFEKIVESLGIERDMSRSAVFQVMFALQNTPSVTEPDLGEIRLTGENNDTATSRFDISLTITLLDSGMQIRIVYNDRLYSELRMEKLLGHYRNLLESIVADKHTTIGELGMLGSDELQQLLHDFRSPAPVIPAEEKTLPALFRAAAARTPAATALLLKILR
ncbi:condensation domain-containing protein [Chitinophaga sp. MD30]|uniref:condensation domain-containing protein n=1 Tax=Chitinophaga sp. MD30 TaxID=2033437 RepID=UPI0012FD28FF|nr:condensation domain-containing protein [Chitinophaga sp. MD30]